MYEVGSKLKTLRKGRKLTQEQVAKHFNVARGSISNYEIGRRKPTIKELQAFAEYYGVGLDYFGVSSSSKDEVLELLARATNVFKNEDIDKDTKEDLYKELMRLYLDLK